MPNRPKLRPMPALPIHAMSVRPRFLRANDKPKKKKYAHVSAPDKL